MIIMLLSCQYTGSQRIYWSTVRREDVEKARFCLNGMLGLACYFCTFICCTLCTIFDNTYILWGGGLPYW